MLRRGNGGRTKGRVTLVQPVHGNLPGGPRLAQERETVRKWAEGSTEGQRAKCQLVRILKAEGNGDRGKKGR